LFLDEKWFVFSGGKTIGLLKPKVFPVLSGLTGPLGVRLLIGYGATFTLLMLAGLAGFFAGGGGAFGGSTTFGERTTG